MLFSVLQHLDQKRQSIQGWTKKNLWNTAFKKFEVHFKLLKAVFYKFYLIHSWKLSFIYQWHTKDLVNSNAKHGNISFEMSKFFDIHWVNLYFFIIFISLSFLFVSCLSNFSSNFYLHVTYAFQNESTLLLQSLKLQISCLFQARSSLTFRQI